MNSNLAVYIGAYLETIHNLAIIVPALSDPIISIVPYLKQMHIAYKIYSASNAFTEKINLLQYNVLLTTSVSLATITLNGYANIHGLDIINFDCQMHPDSSLFRGNWYSVTIYNPNTGQITYVHHTNEKKNIPLLVKLNNYKFINVELI